MKTIRRISIDPVVRVGKPCIRGTRIVVEDILELLEDGIGTERIRKEFYAALSAADIKACISYARAVINNEEIHVIREAA